MVRRVIRACSASAEIAVAVGLVCASCSTGVLAQGGLPYTIEPPEGSVGFGRAVASGGDVDGDGLPDIFVADPSYAVDGEVVGRWHMFSGRDGSLIWSRTADRPCQPYHEYMIVGVFIDDVDGDHRADLIVGVPNADALRGIAYVVSGRTGDVIYQIDGGQPEDRLGLDVTGLGDLNGDRIGEFALITRAIDPGSVAIHDGATGEVMFHAPPTAHPPRRVRNGGDLNGDTVDDIVIGTRRIPNGGGNPEGEVRAVSGRTGELLWTLGRIDYYLGSALATGADLSGDGVPDVIGRTAPTFNQEMIELISGATGQVLASQPRLIGGVNWGAALALADINADRQLDLVAMRIEQGRFGFDVVDPGSWRVLHWAEGLDPRHQFSFFSGNEVAVADVNGDGATDFIIGSVNAGVRVFGGSPLLLNFAHRVPDYTIIPGTSYEFTVGGARPGRVVHLLSSTTGNGCTFIQQLGICIDLDRRLYNLGRATADADRVARFTIEVPPGIPHGPFWLQALDPADPTRGPITSNVMQLEVAE